MKKTISTLHRMKQDKKKIVCLTAYDASFSQMIEAADADVLLVGDSLGMVIQGHGSTTPVSTDEIVYHTQCVRRGAPNSLLIADMPFLSAANMELAISNAGLIMQQGGAEIVKVEGAGKMIEVVENFTEQGIPVCGHLGLTPQSVHKLGGYKVQGKDEKSAEKILQDSIKLEQAGADLLVLECVPEKLAQEISLNISIPTIGIGAGVHCDGQVLVTYDLLGLSHGVRPRFSKDFLAETDSIASALKKYVEDVRNEVFPAPEHTFS